MRLYITVILGLLHWWSPECIGASLSRVAIEYPGNFTVKSKLAGPDLKIIDQGDISREKEVLRKQINCLVSLKKQITNKNLKRNKHIYTNQLYQPTYKFLKKEQRFNCKAIKLHPSSQVQILPVLKRLLIGRQPASLFIWTRSID